MNSSSGLGIHAKHLLNPTSESYIATALWFCSLISVFSLLLSISPPIGPVNILWSLPPQGWFKINVHGFHSDQPFPNGNVSGIEVVIRNHRGRILRMVAGTLGIRDRRLNELYAMLEGLKRAYLDDRFNIELETDNEAACWEWLDAAELGVVPEHRYVMQQLIQRRADNNFKIVVRPIQQNANALARYLASYGAENWDKMVIVAGPFGRIFELWSSDMGLGPIGDQFMAVHELDMNAEVNDDDAVMNDEVLLAQEMI